jgi:hypothetical protein
MTVGITLPPGYYLLRDRCPRCGRPLAEADRVEGLPVYRCEACRAGRGTAEPDGPIETAREADRELDEHLAGDDEGRATGMAAAIGDREETTNEGLPPALAGLDFGELGCHWIAPRRIGSARHSTPESAQLSQCRARLARFVEQLGVRPFKHSYRNLLSLLKQGGAPEEDILRHLVDRWRVNPAYRHHFGTQYGEGSPFDHVELWGRKGRPLILIGHPYQIDSDGFETLAGMERLGMTVLIHADSWYGFGTVQVRAYHRGTVWAAEKELKSEGAS